MLQVLEAELAGIKKDILDINFTGTIDTIEIATYDDKILAYYINGEANFKAIAGFGGEYEGWFSSDNQHVPLAAKMEVFVGSVYLELENWKNWQPKIDLK